MMSSRKKVRLELEQLCEQLDVYQQNLTEFKQSSSYGIAVPIIKLLAILLPAFITGWRMARAERKTHFFYRLIHSAVVRGARFI